MATKHKTINLVIEPPFGRNTAPYRVVKIVNSVEYHPGDHLAKADVEELCSAKDWTVNIIAVPQS